MKIFNNGKVYVQLKDFTYITEIEEIPKSILERLIKNRSILIIREDNKDSFIEFNKKEEIDFFKKQDWIIDFKKVNALSKDELNYLIDSNLIGHSIKNPRLRTHQLESLNDFLNWKKGYKQIPFPLEIDDEQKTFAEDDTYYGKSSLNPNILLIGKKDNSPIEENENITPSLVSSALMESLATVRQNNMYFGDFIVRREYTEDRMYYKIEYHQKPYVKRIETPIEKKKPWIKSIFSKRKTKF